MTDPAELHDKAWATRGGGSDVIEEEEEPVSRETVLRRFRPTRREEIPPELVRRYEHARAAVIQGEEGADLLLARVTEELLDHTTDEDTEDLVRGERVTVTADPPEGPWEVDERIRILDEKRQDACVARVVEVLPDDRYVLQGERDGRLDD